MKSCWWYSPRLIVHSHRHRYSCSLKHIILTSGICIIGYTANEKYVHKTIQPSIYFSRGSNYLFVDNEFSFLQKKLDQNMLIKVWPPLFYIWWLVRYDWIIHELKIYKVLKMSFKLYYYESICHRANVTLEENYFNYN